jgi:hypothetical protein
MDIYTRIFVYTLVYIYTYAYSSLYIRIRTPAAIVVCVYRQLVCACVFLQLDRDWFTDLGGTFVCVRVRVRVCVCVFVCVSARARVSPL